MKYFVYLIAGMFAGLVVYYSFRYVHAILHIEKSLEIIASPPHSITPQASAVDSMYIDSGFIYMREDSLNVAAYPLKDYTIVKRTH